MAPPLQSLVRYDNPVLVSTSKDKSKGKATLGSKKVSSAGSSQAERLLCGLCCTRALISGMHSRA